jgi:hypothetical protein
LRSAEDVNAVLDLRAAGHSGLAIARATGIPRSTIRDWLDGRLPGRRDPGRPTCPTCDGSVHRFDRLGPGYVYLLGLYLGDGCISAHPRGVFRLRVFLDLKYPKIIDACEAAIRELLPNNKVHRLNRASNFSDSPEHSLVEISAYSKRWACLLPQHGPGRKHTRPIELVDWQRKLVARHPELLLRGLIHSDGCRFINTGRGGWRCPRYAFANNSDDIKRIFCDACDLLDLHWTVAPPKTVYVSRKADVARMDEFIGPKT